MMPNIIPQLLSADAQLQTLLGGSGRIAESQSWGTTPLPRPKDGYWLSINFEEMLFSPVSALSRGPRSCTIAVHHPQEIDRDYDTLTSILNRVDEIILPIEDQSGTDGLRVTSIARRGRSGNAIDEGWATITRFATYGVLYQEYAA
jgi:hypothetical protein